VRRRAALGGRGAGLTANLSHVFIEEKEREHERREQLGVWWVSQYPLFPVVLYGLIRFVKWAWEGDVAQTKEEQ
jgi:hypothetical protein